MLSAFMSHQYGLGSYLGVNVICELSLLLVLSLAPRGFSLATPVFPTPLKSTLENSHSTRNGRPKPILWMCYLKMLGTSNFFFLGTHPHYVSITAPATYLYTIMSGVSSKLCRAF